MKQNFLVCYDISCNSRRSKLARRLEACGERVQYSVFHVRMEGVKFEKLQRTLVQLMDEDDELLFIPICKSCFAKAVRAGQPIPLACVA